ncbi:efflux RND transporter permease subunit [Shewanella violacea]|uniref:AcrB/AcrD/AcrF family protein n=1 Tax=Shewanella violacea (strain JCM 10179 / CIP 106290 / LMG 19151 / DSS12) TaxID=637905 RepID=D4ZF26_SHEVD|nr:efflux RND transporter permease subunit [Shewanella violacea]BAJ04190.1 AcrB/AcrD/AcrF family protein [Shewanella violacea DSS12]
MNLTRISTHNPAGTLVTLLLIMIFGILAIAKLPIQLLPDIQPPQISVYNNWRSAAPQEMESNIIEPQENVLRQVPGVIEMTSNISQGFGAISLTFEVGNNMQEAMINVINALNQTPPRPLDANEPYINVGGGGAPNLASLLIRMTPDNPNTDFSKYQKLIDDVVEPRLRRITGVGSVQLHSKLPKELHILFDPYRAAALGITLDQLRSTLSRATNISGGTANVGRRQYTVRFLGQYTPENLGKLIVTYNEGRPVYLNELADVSVSTAEVQGFTKRNGYLAYYITLQGTFDANTVTVLEGVNQAIAELNEAELKDAGLIIDLSFDASVHIKRAILLVKSNLAVGVLLALIILFAFLRSFRATLMIASTIPVALLIAFFSLEAMGRTLNVISLAGLAFAVGLVLDAAIIVQENIVRLLQKGEPLADAIAKGTEQVRGALMASTVTTVAIFLPILFMPGVEGQLFSDLALTLSVAVVSSFISAITLIPVFSLLWLKLPKKTQAHSDKPDLWHKLTELIRKLTGENKRAASWCGLLILGSGILTFALMPRPDFLPQARSDGIFAFFSLPPGTNVNTLESEVGEIIIERLKPYYDKEKAPYIKGYNFSMYAAFNVLFVYPEDPSEADKMIQLLNDEILIGLPDTQAFTNRASLLQFGFNGGRAINIDLQGPDMEALMESASKGMDLITKALPGAVVRPIPGLSMAQPELQLIPNERRLAQAGVDRTQIANAVRAYTSGLFIGEYFDGNDRMDVLLKGPKWQYPEQLAATPVYTQGAGIQTIGELATIKRTVGPTQLQRVNGKRSVSLLIFPPADMSLDEALEIINDKAVPELKAMLPENSSLKFRGSADKLDSTIREMGANFLLAVLILFLLMAAMFKSAKDSLLVLLSMPLAICGGVVSLRLLNLISFQSLDLLTMIGFIILLGLVVNNAILLVDQTRQGTRDGLNIDDAIYQAVATRARPVYMSTLTSIFGMLPLMLVPGVGSEIYRGLAAVIVGGMTFSALFTLILIPSLLKLSHSLTPRARASDSFSPITESNSGAK